MKFSNIASVATLALGVSGSLYRRDLTTINGVLTTIGTKLSALDSAVNAFSGDISALQSASDDVISTLKSGTSTISGTDTLSQTDAVGVATSVQTLETSVQKAVNDIISKKSAIVAGGFGGQVLKALQDQQSGSDALAKALTSKVPTELQSVATQLSAGIHTDIQKGIDAFQGTGGSAPASSSSKGGAAPTSTKTSAATSAVSAPTGSVAPISSGSSPSGTVSSAPSSPAVQTGAAAPAKTGSAFLAVAAVMGLLL
ncbi:hypothetical protein BT63DRAFT_436057 [Microthyrium microscopicum]|uniref:Cell wall mannoprotein 1 n=1 Tax=Microthyrium microscopicum TaxID=703497 RepID=A0A6A6URX7_9PEZI|nr:hypothetical protein BT63DRAFT_436057 [Microthyrium microscopicum]